MPDTAGRKTILLNGTWQVQPTNDDVMPSHWNHTVPVPALIDVASPPYNWKNSRYHWHRTTFKVHNLSDLAFLVVEQAMFGTDVWLNGTHLGGDIACYTSQEYDARPALRIGEANELVVRVGQREHLPAHSAVGKDQERTEWIPGVWGDVRFVQCGNPRIRRVQVIPHIESADAEIRVTVENRSSEDRPLAVSSSVREWKSKKIVSAMEEQRDHVKPLDSVSMVFVHTIPDQHLWSVGDPFLYEVETRVESGGVTVDAVSTRFGMREFKVVGADFYFNGRKTFLRGGNIAFHRFLSDADRGTLPWDIEWVKKLLIDIPKNHNFNFFRNHIGQMYNRWYDIADEHGMLLQNEWMFWTTTGTKEQITHEFTRWLQDNWNHPSIIIWDALNECSDDVVQKEIVPAMKALDPTRPWESVDFVEEHPYIYSLGPVLNDRKFGFARTLQDIEHSSTPTMLNEFCWWWLDKDFNPSLLTKDVVERWLGPGWTKEQLVAHQAFLVSELVELFRRMRVKAIQPFVYLSNNAGPTANWFVGDIRDLQPKPILAALKNAFAPFGISIELWDRHFRVKESRGVRVFVFNDRETATSGMVRLGVVDKQGKWIFENTTRVSVGASGSEILHETILLPPLEGEYAVRAELRDQNDVLVASSDKIAHVFRDVEWPEELLGSTAAVLETDNELTQFLSERGVRTTGFTGLDGCDVALVAQNTIHRGEYQSYLDGIAQFLASGKTLVLIEPGYDIHESAAITLVPGLTMSVEKRADPEKGGYDSYVFADDHAHDLWHGMTRDHLKMFNGGYGGEIVSQHNVTVNHPMKIHARCGMHLAIPAVFEVQYGRGKILVSRLQLRGRLCERHDPENLSARRTDPVLQQYLLNLYGYAYRSTASGRRTALYENDEETPRHSA